MVHQKNILYVSPSSPAHSGCSIFTGIQANASALLLITGLEIQSVEQKEKDVWTPASAKKRPASWVEGTRNHGHDSLEIDIPPGIEKIRVVFRSSQRSQALFVHRSESGLGEVVGSSLFGSLLFPLLQKPERVDVEMAYITRSRDKVMLVSSGIPNGVHDGGTTRTHHYCVPKSRPVEIVFAAGAYEGSHSSKVSVYIPQNLAERFGAGKKETLEILKVSVGALQGFLEQRLPQNKVSVVFSMCETVPVFGQSCAVLHVSDIMTPEAIDQCFVSIRTLSRLVAAQYFPIVPPAAPLDHWMYVGAREYLAAYLSETLLGANETKYELNRDIAEIHQADVHEPPLSSGLRHPDSFSTCFFRKKSCAFFRVLESNLTRAFIQKILREVLEASADPSEGPCTTADLVRIVKNVTGKDMRALFDSYVTRAGIPTVLAHIEQKSGGFVLTVRQKCHSLHPESNRALTGNICIRVFEADSVLDHTVFIGAAPSTHEVPAHKSLRKKHRADETSSLLWVRIDPGLEWIKVAVVEQPDYMFAEQLLNEKDVYGQMEALTGVQKNPSESVCGVLERVMADPHVFYKVRIAAGILLAKSVNEESGYFGFQRVVQYFINHYCIQSTTIVKPNEFRDAREYFLQKNLAASMSLCRLDAVKSLGGRTVRAKNVVSAFLLNLLRYNDNSGNAFSDSFYMSDVVSALSLAICSDAPLDAAPFVAEIERLRRKDLLFPTHRNTVTCASLRALARMSVLGVLEVSEEHLWAYAHSSNYFRVRMAAYECLMLLHASRGALELALRAAQWETRIVRVHILRCLQKMCACASLPHLEKVQEVVPGLAHIRDIFPEDGDTRHAVSEILALVKEKTEIVTVEPGDAVLAHDLSSEEEPPEKIRIKLFKPLIVRIPAVGHYPEKSPNQGSASTPLDLDELYASDDQAKKYGLNEHPDRGMEALASSLRHNKAYGILNQNAKKVHAAHKLSISTLRDVPVADSAENQETRAVLTETPGNPEQSLPQGAAQATATSSGQSAGTPKPGKNGKSALFLFSDPGARPFSTGVLNRGLDTFHGSEGFTSLRRSRNAEYTFDPYFFYLRVLTALTEFFVTAQYDTSSYSTVKYFAMQVEREYMCTIQMDTRGVFTPLDGEESSVGTVTDGESEKGKKEKNKQTETVSMRMSLQTLLDELMAEDAHRIFSAPIEIERLRPLKYAEIIRRPVDLHSIQQSLKQGEYVMAECVFDDILLVFRNCTTYNQKESSIYTEARRLEELAVQKIEKVHKGKSQGASLNSELKKICSALCSAEYYIFQHRVCSVTYPQYYAIVKKPMTLQQILENTERKHYKNLSHFEADVQKIHVASTVYNGGISEITKLSKKLLQESVARVRKAFPWHKSAFAKRATGPVSSKSSK